jgi:hypothetical protein
MDNTATSERMIERQQESIRWIAVLERFGVLIFLLLLILFFETQNDRFLYLRNVFNILSDVSIYGIMAVGMTFVILTAGTNLSIGSLLAFCSMCGAAAIKGTGEARYAISDPHAFWGCSWCLLLQMSANRDTRGVPPRKSNHKAAGSSFCGNAGRDDGVAGRNIGNCRRLSHQWV